MKFALPIKFSTAAIAVALLAPVAVQAEYNNNSSLTIYFTRHAEKQTVTTAAPDLGAPTAYTTDADGDYEPVAGTTVGSYLAEICGDDKCAEELSKKGATRALLLAEWFEARNIRGKIDAVYATHKIRTQQTVMPTATAEGLEVINVVPDGTELNPQSTSQSECGTLVAIENSIAAGHNTILVAGHSGTLYDIMGSGVVGCELESDLNPQGLGLDTSDANRFPKDEDGKVRDFGDVWKVVIRPNGTVKFKYRKALDFTRLNVVNTAN